MHVTCEAPAHRVVVQDIKPQPTGAALLNIANGGIPGTLVDADSGALYKYPDLISVDFRNVAPSLSPYPAYYNSDTLPPQTAGGIESYESDSPALQGDDALKARHSEAYEAAVREQAEASAREQEKQRRINALEGGFYGDKGHAK